MTILKLDISHLYKILSKFSYKYHLLGYTVSHLSFNAKVCPNVVDDTRFEPVISTICFFCSQFFPHLPHVLRANNLNEFTIAQEGEKITVTIEGRMGEMTGENTCVGNEAEWTFTMETPRGDFTLVYKAPAGGDTMAGTVTMGERSSREWTAKKK